MHQAGPAQIFLELLGMGRNLTGALTWLFREYDFSMWSGHESWAGEPRREVSFIRKARFSHVSKGAPGKEKRL